MKYLQPLLLLVFMSCGNDHAFLKQVEEIKQVGDTNATLALEMLDSLRTTDAVPTQYAAEKMELLEIRLHDKAYITHTTDSAILALVEYFNNHGTNRDRQEAYYYAGSVYRDLQDIPRSLENFLMSEKIATEGDCDSMLLRSTYSNLQAAYNKVQDFDNSLLMAEKELQISEQLNVVCYVNVQHVVCSLIGCKRRDEAVPYLDRTFKLFMDADVTEVTKRDVFTILNNCRNLGQLDKARQCMQYLRDNDPAQDYLRDPSHAVTIAGYFREIQQLDSAKYYFQILLSAKNLFCRIKFRCRPSTFG